MTTWTDKDGRQWVACTCLKAWLTAYQNELLRRGIIKRSIDVFQLVGGATASAGTHSTGGAFDIAQTSREAIVVARQMGADATWHRMPPSFDHHTHGVLRGCPHNGPARYQLDAVDAGYNGLGDAGRGARDDGPRPLSGRTWKQGIAWASTLKPAIKPTPTGGFLMALSDKEQDEALTILRDLRTGRAGQWPDGPGGRMTREIRNNVRVLKADPVDLDNIADEIAKRLPKADARDLETTKRAIREVLTEGIG